MGGSGLLHAAAGLEWKSVTDLQSEVAREACALERLKRLVATSPGVISHSSSIDGTKRSEYDELLSVSHQTIYFGALLSTNFDAAGRNTLITASVAPSARLQSANSSPLMHVTHDKAWERTLHLGSIEQLQLLKQAQMFRSLTCRETSETAAARCQGMVR